MNVKSEYYPNKAVFYLNSKIYKLSCIMKAGFNFIDDFYLFFDYENEDTIRVDFKSKESRAIEEIKKIVGEFHNELLNQSIRYKVSKETKNVRELILGRALYNTCIEDEKCHVKEPEFHEDIELNFNKLDTLNIGTNWFEQPDNGDK